MNDRKNAGFTLIELMMTLLVAGVVLGFGIPAFTEFIANNRMAASVNDFTSAIHMARTEAVKRRANVTLCPSADWNTDNPSCANAGSFADGWIVFIDCTVAPPPANTCGVPTGQPDYSFAGVDPILRKNGPLPDQIADNFSTNNGTPEYLSFSAVGFPRQIPALATAPKTDFQLCDDRGNKDLGGGLAAGRWLRISATGRPQIYREVAEIQDGDENPLGGC